ncbi:MAG: signal peptidase I [Candidatus Acidiferrales bacterium]
MSESTQPEAPVERDAAPAARRLSPLGSLLVGWLRDLFIALALALIIIAFVYQPVKVEGTSMAPHLTDQERIFINKFVYEFEPIRRGDVVVFRYPRDEHKSFIKRVVGLPGELVEIRRGAVYIDGVPLREDYLPGAENDQHSFPPTYLPPGNYFVLGDHRRNSNDSRSWGTVQREQIYGKAVFAYWPPERFGPIPVPPPEN